MAAIQWAAYDPKTGRIIEPLPGLRLESDLPNVIGRDDGITVSLPVTDRLPKRWQIATQPWRVVIAAHYDDDDMTVLWAGIPSSRTYGSDPTIRLSLVPVEGWLARQYVTTQTHTNVDTARIGRRIGLDMIADSFNATVTEIATGRTLTRRYRDDDDKTALAALQELMQTEGGPEFNIGWRFEAGVLRCLPTIAPRIGRAIPASQQPPFVIKQASWERVEDYSDGKGATIVTGLASRQGDQRTQVTRRDDVLINGGWLPAEYRYQPDTNVTSTASLTPYVTQKLTDIKLGTVTLSVSMHIDDVTLGVDVGIGDDVAMDLINDDLPELSLTTRARMIGWNVTADKVSGEITTITPILYGQD